MQETYGCLHQFGVGGIEKSSGSWAQKILWTNPWALCPGKGKCIWFSGRKHKRNSPNGNPGSPLISKMRMLIGHRRLFFLVLWKRGSGSICRASFASRIHFPCQWKCRPVKLDGDCASRLPTRSVLNACQRARSTPIPSQCICLNVRRTAKKRFWLTSKCSHKSLW